MRAKTRGWRHIGEGLVHHQQAPLARPIQQGGIRQPPVGIVGRAEHQHVGIGERRGHLPHGVTRSAPGGRVFAIGRADNGDAAGGQQGG